MNKIPEKYYLDIIKTIMGLDSQHIWIGSQNIEIEINTDLYVIISNAGIIPITNNSFYDFDTSKNIIESISKQNIQIDVMSQSNAARDRRMEILMSLSSYYSLEQQYKYQFKIFKLSSNFNNTTELEGSRYLNRYTVIVPCMVWDRMEVAFNYYDTFPAEINFEDDSKEEFIIT